MVDGGTDVDVELSNALKSMQQDPEFSVPGDVSSLDHLADVPNELLNCDPTSATFDKHRPLLHTDANDNVYTYALNPLTYSVFLILVLELLERFSFYGLYMTQTNFLMGSYDEEWNAGTASMDAASLVSLSTAVAYTAPFAGGMLADRYLGDYKTILAGLLYFTYRAYSSLLVRPHRLGGWGWRALMLGRTNWHCSSFGPWELARSRRSLTSLALGSIIQYSNAP
jgi:hypothetical protein